MGVWLTEAGWETMRMQAGSLRYFSDRLRAGGLDGGCDAGTWSLTGGRAYMRGVRGGRT